MILTILTIILLVTVLVGFNALYVAGEFSAVSARRTRILQMADEGNRLASMILPIMEDPRKLDAYIAASQVGITISSIVLGIYGQQQIAPLITPLLTALPIGAFAGEAGGQVAAAGVSATLVLIVLTILQVVLGELVPKSIAIQYPEQVAIATAIPMKWSADIILKPLIMLLNGSGALILRLLGVEYSGEHSHVHSPEEILILVKEAHRGGLLDADERRLLQNVFRVGDVHAGEIAVPRTRMVAAELNEPVETVLARAAESAFTRIPIYDKDIDHVVGFVHLKELFNLYRQDASASLRQILRTAPFVPEALAGTEVWERLNETESYLAIVIDEYGGTAGMLTREDLIEELFGELQDEFDRERALITPAGAGRLIVRGDMTISYLCDLFDLILPHEAANTVGGLVVEILGDVPEVGTTVKSGDVHLRVEAVANHAVTSVCVILPPDKAELPQEGLAL